MHSGSLWCSGSSHLPLTSVGEAPPPPGPVDGLEEGPEDGLAWSPDPEPELSAGSEVSSDADGAGDGLVTVASWPEVGRGSTPASLVENVDTKYAPKARATGSVIPAMARAHSFIRLMRAA